MKCSQILAFALDISLMNMFRKYGEDQILNEEAQNLMSSDV